MREKELIEMGSDFLDYSRKLARKLFNSFKPLLSKEEGIIEVKPKIKELVAKVNIPKASTPEKPKYKPTLEDNYIRPNKSSRLTENHMHSMMQSNEYLSSTVSVLSNKTKIGKSIVSALQDLKANDMINNLGKAHNIPVQEHMIGRDFFTNAQVHKAINSRDVNYDEKFTPANAFKKMIAERGDYIKPTDLQEPLFAQKVFEILNHANDFMRNIHKEEREKYGIQFSEKMEERQKFEINYFEYMVAKNVFNNATEQKKYLEAATMAFGSFIEADMIDLSKEFNKTINPSPTFKMQRAIVKEMPVEVKEKFEAYTNEIETYEQQKKATSFVENNLSKEKVLANIASITQKRNLPRGLAVMEGVSDEVQAKNIENVSKLANTEGLLKDVESMGEARQAIKKQIQENRAKQKL